MGNKETKLQIVIDAQNNTAAAFKSLSGSLEGVTSSMKAIGTVGVAALAAETAELFKSVEAASQSQQVQAQLGAVLRSTGQAAGVTSAAAIALSKSLEGTTKFSDEAVLSAENLLLTFTSIHKDVFPQATQTVLDMATALGEDTKDAAIQLGKALQDPILGVTALRRVGVNFNDQQQEQIKTMVESGNLLQAQTFILNELSKEFGGSATAAAATYSGTLAQLNNELDDFQEEIGNALLPSLTTLAKTIFPVIEQVTQWAIAHPQLTQAIVIGTIAITALLAVLLPIAVALPGLVILFGLLGTAFAAVTAISAPLLLAIGGVVTALVLLGTNGYATGAAWQAVWLGIKLTVADAANSVIGVIEGMINFIIDGVNKAIAAINKVISAAQKVPGIGKNLSTIKQLDHVDLATLDTDAITTNDLASRNSPATSSPVIQMAGNVFLDQNVAQQIGDMIMQQLKLSKQM